jgi:hypothetical protein
VMTEGLDGSFRYPKCAYLAAISAQVSQPSDPDVTRVSRNAYGSLDKRVAV